MQGAAKQSADNCHSSVFESEGSLTLDAQVAFNVAQQVLHTLDLQDVKWRSNYMSSVTGHLDGFNSTSIRTGHLDGFNSTSIRKVLVIHISYKNRLLK